MPSRSRPDNPTPPPRVARAARLRELQGEDRNAAKRDELLDLLIDYVLGPDTALDEDDQ